MRASVIWALAALLAVIASIVFLMRDTLMPPDRREHSHMSESTASQHAELVAALDRVSREVQDLRMEIKQVRTAMAEVETNAATRPGLDRMKTEANESPSALSRAEIPPATPQIIRSKLVDRPDPERRKRLEDLIALPYEDQARSQWFLTYAEVLDRYGTPDGIVSSSDGCIEFNYRLKDGLMHLRFRDGVGIGVWYERQ